MNTSRHGSWIQTYTGIQFWPMDPRPEEINILDIAHALSMLCRFNGHCNRFYSVAEHCVHVSTIVAPEFQLWGLMHDAAEAYLSDIPRPIKRVLADFKGFEEHLLTVIAARFSLSVGIPTEICHADGVLLATEKNALMGKEPAAWAPLPDSLDPAMIRCLSPEEAKTLFLEHFRVLHKG